MDKTNVCDQIVIENNIEKEKIWKSNKFVHKSPSEDG